LVYNFNYKYWILVEIKYGMSYFLTARQDTPVKLGKLRVNETVSM